MDRKKTKAKTKTSHQLSSTSFFFLLFLFHIIIIINLAGGGGSRTFGLPYLSKAQEPQKLRYPFL